MLLPIPLESHFLLASNAQETLNYFCFLKKLYFLHICVFFLLTMPFCQFSCLAKSSYSFQSQR